MFAHIEFTRMYGNCVLTIFYGNDSMHRDKVIIYAPIDVRRIIWSKSISAQNRYALQIGQSVKVSINPVISEAIESFIQYR